MTLILFASSGALLFMIVFLIALTDEAPVHRVARAKTAVERTSVITCGRVPAESDSSAVDPVHEECNARAA